MLNIFKVYIFALYTEYFLQNTNNIYVIYEMVIYSQEPKTYLFLSVIYYKRYIHLSFETFTSLKNHDFFSDFTRNRRDCR